MMWCRVFLCLLGMLVGLCAEAQPRMHTLLGRIIESETQTPLPQASVRLLAESDSSFISGTFTAEDGRFRIQRVTSGHYLLHLSFLGFQSRYLPLHLRDSLTTDIGTVVLSELSVMLGETTITAQAPPIVIVEDTTVYNSAAYKVTEGAVLEELLQQLPGAVIDEEGKVTINGEELKKIMVNGKEFFGGDVKTALKNLPVEMIDKLKTYEKESDMKRITGIDDGEDEIVLDVVFKKNKSQGWFGNLNAAGGTRQRYAGKAMVNHFDRHSQFAAIASLNNVNDRDFPSGAWSDWKNIQGNTALQNIGIDYTFENKLLEVGGHIRYDGNDNEQTNSRASERFNNRKSSFTRSESDLRNQNRNFRSDFRIEWRPNAQTNLIFRPSLAYASTDNRQASVSEAFDQDPTLWWGTLGLFSPDTPEYATLPDSIRINSARNRNTNQRQRWNGNLSFQVSRKLNTSGRNLTLATTANFSNSQNDRYRLSDTRYFRLIDSLGEDSVLVRNQYTDTPTRQWGYSLQMTYSEPVAQATFLQLSYKFTYKRNQSDRYAFDLPDSQAEADAFQPIDSLSKNAAYDYYNHEIALTLRLVREKYRLSAGVSLQPQSSRLSYRMGDTRADTLCSVFNFAPRIDFQYRFSKKSRLKLTYNVRSTQPNIENMLPIADNSNPLNIRVGNPGLKPSFTHMLRMNLKLHRAARQQTLTVQTRFTLTQNAVSNSSSYNEETGGRVTTPRNINGNWDGHLSVGLGTALRDDRFYLHSQTSLNYRNNVAYLYNKSLKLDEKNTATQQFIQERISALFRCDRWSITLAAAARYIAQRNKLYPQNDENLLNYSLGGRLMYTLPWKMTLTANLVSQSRRGYNDASMNRHEWIGNVSLAQSLCRGRATISLELYDVLSQRTTLTQATNTNSRSLSVYNGVHSYGMMHFIYRFNQGGGTKAARHHR